MKTFRQRLKRVPGPKHIAFCHRLRAGKFTVSIQCSQYHYSFPRENLRDPKAYAEYEVAIFDRKGHWWHPDKNKKVKKTEWAKFFETGGRTAVAGYVPGRLVQKILNTLETL